MLRRLARCAHKGLLRKPKSLFGKYCGSTALQTAMTQARETAAVLVADL
jgi:hypothetical protein